MVDTKPPSGPDGSRPHPTKSSVVHRERLLDMFFKVDRLVVSHEKFDGRMSEPKAWLVFERGDSAAALLFDREQREVILVDQFRAATLGTSRTSGWIVETAAGMIKVAETPEQCIVREIQEEVGYQISELVPVATFFSSPGGTSERIFLYYAEVRSTQRTGAGGGVDDGEDIEVVKMPLADFMRRLNAHEFEDPKIIIAGQWLREHRQQQRSEGEPMAGPQYYAVTSTPDKQVGFLVGDIVRVHDIDVWVNPENTDMMMDRFFARSISAKIRFLGARKFPTGEVEDDTIGDDLQRQMHRRRFVALTSVIDTTSGNLLSAPHNVQRIFHVATVKGAFGQGVTTDNETLATCVDAVLAAIDKQRIYRSVLIPMIGTGAGGLLVKDVAPKLVERAVSYLEKNPASRIEKIVFLGYSAGDGDILARVLDDLGTSSADASEPRLTRRASSSP